MMFIDARVPVRFGPIEGRTAGEAVLTDGAADEAPPCATFGVETAHPIDCSCCTPRSGAARALAALFRDRALGTGQPFRSVLAVVGPEGEAAVRAALIDDPVASARFRLM